MALTDPTSRHAKHFVPDQSPGKLMELTFERTEPAREGGSYRVTMTADERIPGEQGGPSVENT